MASEGTTTDWGVQHDLITCPKCESAWLRITTEDTITRFDENGYDIDVACFLMCPNPQCKHRQDEP